MYCMHCGKKIDENLLICPHCGTAQNQVTKKDYGGIGWGILGYFVPMAGIILFFIWKNEKPKTAKVMYRYRFIYNSSTTINHINGHIFYINFIQYTFTIVYIIKMKISKI